jgi:transposase
MPRNLTETQKMLAISKLEEGWSLKRVAANLNVSHSCISKIKRKWALYHTIARAVTPGRPKVTNDEEDAALVDHINQNLFSNAVEARQIASFSGSIRTARRKIRAAGLASRSAARKPFLTEALKENRVGFALQHLNEGPDFWNKVVFSDEKVFKSCYDGRIRVYRPRNSRYSEKYTHKLHTSGKFSVNVWAWISADGQGACFKIKERLTGVVYRDILENVMLPSVT